MRGQGVLRRVAAGATGLVALLAGGWLLYSGSGSDTAVETASAERAAAKKDLPGLPWEAEPAETTKPSKQPLRPPEKNGVAIGGPESMPPASVGSNGSYTPRPAAERERIGAVKFAGDGAAQDAALLVGDTAIAPFGAPDAIQGAISAANQITDQPYRWGGGHAGWRSRGYDCSGAVSYALAGGGLLGVPATSGQLMSWGEPGRGRWLTVYANPGHVYAVIAGLRWDTVGLGRGEGPRWHPADAYPSGYVARHIPGL